MRTYQVRLNKGEGPIRKIFLFVYVDKILLQISTQLKCTGELFACQLWHEGAKSPMLRITFLFMRTTEETLRGGNTVKSSFNLLGNILQIL